MLIKKICKNNALWCKKTIKYAIKHRDVIDRSVRHLGNTFRLDFRADVLDMIYSDLLLALYHSADYDSEKVEELFKNGSNQERITLERYVCIIAKSVAKRHIKALYNDKNISIDTDRTDTNGTLHNILYSAERADNICCLRDSLQSLEPIRYINNIDIYTVLYITIASDNLDIKNRVIKALNLTDKDISVMYSKLKNNSKFLDVVSEIAKNQDKAKDVLSEYVYQKDTLDKLILAATYL